jgi:hypothetical protein
MFVARVHYVMYIDVHRLIGRYYLSLVRYCLIQLVIVLEDVVELADS